MRLKLTTQKKRLTLAVAAFSILAAALWEIGADPARVLAQGAGGPTRLLAISGSMKMSRAFAAATSLASGRVLLTGGIDSTYHYLPNAMIWAMQTRLQFRARESDRRRPIISIVLSQLTLLPFIVAGVSLAVGRLGGLYWLAIGAILSVTMGVKSAWVLLVEILR